MKNVMIFQDYDTSETYGHQWKEDELFRYFRCQIDNSINFGWKPEDICIVTNLDFEYRGVNIVRTKLLCTYNKYFNKVFGIYELLKDNLLDDDIWFHDFDDWQLSEFDEFPYFPGDIGGCKYLFGNPIPQWNTGSLFVKKSSLPIWEYIYNTMEANKNEPNINQYGDENIFNMCVHQHFQPAISEIDYTYNVGCTGFQDRLDRVFIKPVKVGGFKPNKKEIGIFKDLIPDSLMELFKKYKLNETN
jgi:hypothetical protein|tara:strand:+ start:387 stop:1121 length:735 start_codon:yes stop_codon:yes gene_type:complete